MEIGDKLFKEAEKAVEMRDKAHGSAEEERAYVKAMWVCLRIVSKAKWDTKRDILD